MCLSDTYCLIFVQSFFDRCISSQLSSVIVLTSSQAHTTLKARQFHQVPQFCKPRRMSNARTELPFHPIRRTICKGTSFFYKFPASSPLPVLRGSAEKFSHNPEVSYPGARHREFSQVLSIRSSGLTLIIRACTQVKRFMFR